MPRRAKHVTAIGLCLIFGGLIQATIGVDGFMAAGAALIVYATYLWVTT